MPIAPTPEPQYTARQLLAHIRRKGGRIFRFPQTLVFALTTDAKLAEWLIEMGGRAFVPKGAQPGDAQGGYLRARGGTREWDIYIHTIPVRGDLSVHEAAGLPNADTTEYRIGDPPPEMAA
jgi:hypothetical protein